MKISVIVPVYNVMAYLDECVNSVVSQSYADLEIILVDDGSTDDSGKLCDAWAEKDTRIRVVHKLNGGLSDARNAGIPVATGEYVLFLDSDDFWEDADAVKRLVERAQKSEADVITFSYTKFYEDSGKKECYFPQKPDMPIGLSHDEQMQFLGQHGVYIASACNKLLRRSLLDESMLFRKGVYSEDIEWCALLLTKVRSIDFIYENFYCYRQRAGSISHAYRDKNCSDLVDAFLRCLDCTETVDGAVKNMLLQYTAFQFSTFFMTQALAERYQKEMIAKMKPYKGIMAHHGGNRKIQLLRICCSMIGYTATCRLLRWIYHKRS